MGCSKSISKRKVYSNTILPQETRNISNKQPNLAYKVTRERTTSKIQSVRKEIIKVRAKINEIETKNKFFKKSRKLPAASLKR